MVFPSGPLPALSPVFTDVLATRIADYTGRDRSEVLAIVRNAGDRLPDRAADLMLENLRAHVGDETPAERDAASLEEERAREAGDLIRGLDEQTATRVESLATRHSELPPRPAAGEMADVAAEAPAHADWAEFELDLRDLVRGLDPETGSRVREHVTNSGPLPPPTARDEYLSADRRLRERLRADVASAPNDRRNAFVESQQARVHAERVFAGALGVLHPVATSLGEPHALRAEREARIGAVLAPAGGEPLGWTLGRQTVDRWLTEADRVAAGIRADPGSRERAVQEFGETVVGDLRKAAGYTGREQSWTATPDAGATFRDGLADHWVSRTAAPRVFENLPLPPELDGLRNRSWPPRWEGRMVAGFAESMAEHTGLPEGEVLERVGSAIGQDLDRRSDRHQVFAAARLLLPDERAEYVAPRYPGGYNAGELQRYVADGIVWGYEEWYRGTGNERGWEGRREPSRPEAAGAAMADRGAFVVDEMEKVARQTDDRLRATVNAGFTPETGRGGPGPGTAAVEGQAVTEDGARGRPAGQAQPRKDRGSGPRGG